ncbi:MAG TPA: hypothetical protein VFM18_19085 [Methanosarcina sp.]|nr:hypothetical protein [Methanosarcina sp.]
MADIGFIQAAGIAVANPLPVSWIGRPTAPSAAPAWANTDQLTSAQNRNLLAQIGYDKSGWNYSLIGTNNAVGRYQFSTQQLENYGILASGSNSQFGFNCVNYKTCWKSATIRSSNSYSNFNYNVSSLAEFLSNTASQDHLAYQLIYDIYRGLADINAILSTDTADTIAGMIYVGWDLGIGTMPSQGNPNGTGAYAWRFAGIGNGVTPFNSGRYSVLMLG